MNDLISRQAAIDQLHQSYNLLDAEQRLEDLPSAQPEIKPSVTSTTKKCHNISSDYAECDQFVCSNCGIELQDWRRVERDEEDGDITYHEYIFNYCPNCGAKL